MSIWKEISQAMLKFGEIALIKAEILTQMAKCRIAIRNKEAEIDKIRIEIGDYTISRIEQKETITEEIVRFKIDTINGIKREIEELNKKFEEIKSQLINNGKSDASGTPEKDKQV